MLRTPDGSGRSCLFPGSFAVSLVLPLLLLGGCSGDKLVIEQARATLPADGRVYPLLELRRSSGDPITPGEIDPGASGDLQLRLEQAGARELRVLLKTPVTPGRALVSLGWSKNTYTIPVEFSPESEDSYGDGTPDFLRLHSVEDRRAFRAWFSALADLEAEQPASRVPPEIDDCAALLRFVYRETLARHDAQWLARQPSQSSLLSLASIHQYRYPWTPLGATLFRVKPGPFAWADLNNGSFAQFADAQTLMRWNTHPVSRDLRAARPGDLLFFRQAGQDSPYHSMIVTGENADWLVYHTGPIGKAKGEIRRVTIEDLIHHPDTRWRPVPGNANFLGVYRWNVLRDGE